jgi:hypothetical protein
MDTIQSIIADTDHMKGPIGIQPRPLAGGTKGLFVHVRRTGCHNHMRIRIIKSRVSKDQVHLFVLVRTCTKDGGILPGVGLQEQ